MRSSILRFHPRRFLYILIIAALLLLVPSIFYFQLVAQDASRHEEWWRPPFQEDIQWSEYTSPHDWTQRTLRLDLPELRRLVAGRNGYYVRDWSVGLGWNNLRYTIETALLHAKLLNRVLVLPSFVYARSCEFSIDVCSQYGLFVDRTEAIGWNSWDGAPLSTLAWQLPMQVMIDLPHLRKAHPVILTSEFFELHGLDPSFESLAGDWNRGEFEVNVTFPLVHVIPNEEYDPSNVVRVDTLQGLPTVDKTNNEVEETLKAALDDRLVLEWDDALRALRAKWQIKTDADVERMIHSGGWVVTHSFLGAGGMDYTKTVIDPIKQVTPRSRLRGFVEDYAHVKTEVLHLEGEIHLGRKPGGLRFTTVSTRDAFTHLVLFSLRPITPVRMLAKALAERMTARCGERMWMAAHMRRGDFVAIGWSMEKSLENHLIRIRNRLAKGRETLGQITIPQRNVSGVEPDLSSSLLALPHEDDPFFLATDEREQKGLEYLRNNSAILVYDLITIEDRRSFGWLLLFTDILGLVEQSLVVQSAYFYGHALSSFTGGVVNMRAARGADPRTILVD